MSWVILDESKTRELSPEKRLEKYSEVIKNEKDASKRWDAIWLTGELARDVGRGPLFDKAADLFVWNLDHDDDGVVMHETCYQISACDMREKIPDLLRAGLENNSSLARHEAIEVLGSMEAFEVMDDLKKALRDPVPYVVETAKFSIKRLERMQHRKGQYNLSEVL